MTARKEKKEVSRFQSRKTLFGLLRVSTLVYMPDETDKRSYVRVGRLEAFFDANSPHRKAGVRYDRNTPRNPIFAVGLAKKNPTVHAITGAWQ